MSLYDVASQIFLYVNIVLCILGAVFNILFFIKKRALWRWLKLAGGVTCLVILYQYLEMIWAHKPRLDPLEVRVDATALLTVIVAGSLVRLFEGKRNGGH